MQSNLRYLSPRHGANNQVCDAAPFWARLTFRFGRAFSTHRSVPVVGSLSQRSPDRKRMGERGQRMLPASFSQTKTFNDNLRGKICR